MSDRELLTECLDVLTHDAAQRTFAGGVRMSQLAIKLRAALAAPRPEPEPVPEPATDAKLLLAYRQRGCGFYMEFREIWQAAERFHGITKEDKT